MDSRRDLALALTDVGAHVEWPEPPTAFAARVAGKLHGETPALKPLLRRFAPALGALAVLVAALLTFSPATRDAVADFIGLGGVRIERGGPDVVPTDAAATPRLGETFEFGEPVSLEEAEGRVDFDLVVPTLPALGAPDEVYLSPRRPLGGLVALVYGARPGYETDPISDVSVLITEFRASLEDQGDFFKKLAGLGTSIRRVEVNGSEGYWLSGEPHSFFYRDSGGTIVQESLRLVDSVLLWEQDGVTIRVETTGSLRGAQDVAESFR